MTSDDLKKDLKKLANPRQAAILSHFFKTGPGEYGEGDIFLGIKVPIQRRIARQYSGLALADLQQLLSSKIHEYRLAALFILVDQFQKADEADRKKIYEFYLKNSKNINNWDLVDLTAPKIVGVYLLDRPRAMLYKLARSKNLWERRIAVLATFTFIRVGQFTDILLLAEKLLTDKHDLMHKAVGWMLRELGKRDEKILEVFLEKFYRRMPRTMLRYSIERLGEKRRRHYLEKSRI